MSRCGPEAHRLGFGSDSFSIAVASRSGFKASSDVFWKFRTKVLPLPGCVQFSRESVCTA